MTSDPLLVIADDDPDMRALVRSTLHQDFPNAVEVGNGRDLFWNLLCSSFAHKGESPHEMVVVADVRMPAYNGLDVLDAWQDGASDAPIVIITAFPDAEVRARVKRLGAALLPKPFTCAGLRAAVRHVARRRP
jgi:DNA-binding response OmpR family regulator